MESIGNAIFTVCQWVAVVWGVFFGLIRASIILVVVIAICQSVGIHIGFIIAAVVSTLLLATWSNRHA